MTKNKTKIFGFLPTLCTSKSLLRLALAAVVLSIVLALAVAKSFSGFFNQLGMILVFILTVTLITAAITCLLSRSLQHKAILTSSIIITLTALFLTLLLSLLGIYLRHSNEVLQITESDILFIIRNLIIAALITLLTLRYFYIQEQWQESIKADSAARYSALQSRMRPHFLFNSLNTIAQLTTVNPERAEDAILDLADIFRSTLDTRDRVSLGEELDVTTRYLRMEGLRLGKRRLTVVWDMDRNTLPFDMPVPPLLLQPLVENAIYHGIQPRKDGGTLGISLYDAGNHLVVSVSNPIPPSGTNSHQKGNHIAQENLKNRLKIAYGERANLKITKATEQYRVSFTIPKE